VGADQSAVDVAGDQRSDADGIVAARLDDRDVFFGVEFPVAQQHARDEIRGSAEAADRYAFAFEIGGKFARLARDEAERDAVHPAGDDSHVQNAGSLEVEHCRYIGVGEIDIAADQRLRGYRPAIEINRFDVEIVFGPETGLVDGIIETLGPTGAAVTHLERWLRIGAARACHRAHGYD